MPSILGLISTSATINSSVKDALSRTFSLESTLRDVNSVYQINEQMLQSYSVAGGDQAVYDAFRVRLDQLGDRINLHSNDSGSGSVFSSNRRELRKILKDLIQLRNELLPVCQKKRVEMLNENIAKVGETPSSPKDTPVVAASNSNSPRGSTSCSVFVQISPVPESWGADADIDKEVKALIEKLPCGYDGSKDIHAIREKQPGVVLVEFPTALDAIRFDNSWESQKPKGFENVKVEILPE